MSFSRSYLVAATQRSGSTLLCELLKDTGVAGRPQEYFEAMRDTGVPPHPKDYLQSLPNVGLGIRSDPRPAHAPPYSSLRGLSGYRQHLERSFALGTTANGVFASKLMWRQLPELHALAGQLPEYAGLDVPELLARLFREPAYVWVSRRNKVRQAVSMWRALQSRCWRSGDGDENADHELHYDFDAIDHLAQTCVDEDRAWGEFFDQHGLPALRLSYEDDLERDREGAVGAVLERLDIAWPAGWRAPEPTERQADALSEQWVAAYHRDRVARGNRPAAGADDGYLTPVGVR